MEDLTGEQAVALIRSFKVLAAERHESEAAADLYAAACEIMKSIPQEKRKILFFYYGLEKSREEIASELGYRSARTIETIIYRAMGEVRRRYTK